MRKQDVCLYKYLRGVGGKMQCSVAAFFQPTGPQEKFSGIHLSIHKENINKKA